MRICLVSQRYPPQTARGGIGSQTWNKAHTLTGLGHTVHVLSCLAAARPGPDVSTEAVDGITIHRMQPPGEEPGREFTVHDEAVYSLGYAWSVARHIQRLSESTGFDVVEFAEYGAEGFVYQLNGPPPTQAVPVVVQLHGPLAMLAERLGWPEADGGFYQVGTFMEGVSIRRAEGLMACSANIADFTAAFYGVPRDSIDVVHCGVDAEAFRPPDETEQPAGRPTVLFVGNITEKKGLNDILEAVLRLRSKYPDIRLQIVGKCDDRLEQRIRSQVRSAGAQGNVEFVGFVDDRAELPDFYRRAHVLCSPSHYEGGVANAYIEAMACGCPVVASTAGAAPEAVVDGATGLLVPPNAVGSTAAALDRILGDASLRRRMSQAGRGRVEAYFAMDRYVLRILASYEKAINRLRQSAGRPGAAVARGAVWAEA